MRKKLLAGLHEISDVAECCGIDDVFLKYK
jgi:hypothetical protein